MIRTPKDTALTQDADGKPFPYRRGVFPTIVSLAIHPIRHDRPSLGVAIWLIIYIWPHSLAMIAIHVVRFTATFQQTGQVSMSSLGNVLLYPVLLWLSYLFAKRTQRFAAAYDLKAGRCPACGYALEPGDQTTCPECGRRWRVAERSSPPPGAHRR